MVSHQLAANQVQRLLAGIDPNTLAVSAKPPLHNLSMLPIRYCDVYQTDRFVLRGVRPVQRFR